MEKVFTDNAPRAIGPYSQAVKSGGMVFTSGQIGLVPATGEMAAGGIEGQTRQVLANLTAVLEAAGSSTDKVIKTTCFLADMADFAVFNSLYGEVFTSCPARSCVAAAGLPKGALVEIEAVALID